MNVRANVIALSLFAASFLAMPTAHASIGMQGYNCANATTWSSNQCANAINDDSSSYAGKYTTDCYGACGPGCSYNCSSGGACLTHDYYTRAYGMFSSQAMSAFPAALAQWGRCEMGAGATAVSGYLKSAWSGLSSAASSVVSSIFN
jgi:hypothetical protein